MTIDLAKPVNRLLEALADGGCEPKATGAKQWQARCPAHDDRRPSLSIGCGDNGTALLKCLAGCRTSDVVTALGLKLRDLFPKKPNRSARRREGGGGATVEARYEYTDERGELLFYAFRMNPKRFWQGRPDGKGGVIKGLGDVRRVLYRLRDLASADANCPVYVVEGEKDADRLAGLGLVATTCPMGAGKWGRVDDAPLHGRQLRIIPDNDAPGREHADDVARRLYGKATSVRIIKLPDLPEHGDVSDWLDAGGSIDALAELAEDAPEYQGTATQGEPRRRRSYPLTDLGNAERLADQHNHTVRYVHPWGKWLVWTGTRWTVDDRGCVPNLAKETVRSIYAEASKIEDEAVRKATARHARASEADAKIRAMLNLAQSEPGVPILPEDLDKNPWLFNCANGTIDLRAGELRPHDPNDLLTKTAGAKFDPEATSELWDRVLAEATGGDPQVIAFLQRIVGYSLTGRTDEEKLFFLHGPTASGKSTFIDAVAATLGDYATTADFDTFIDRRHVGGPRADVARLAGARLVAAVEVDRGKRLAHSLVKTLTGGDTVAARHLYQESFEFKPQFKLWLVSNPAPKVDDDDAAMWRRIVRVPFDTVIPKAKRDPKVKATLKSDPHERAAILRWAVDGCLAWRAEGLRVPESIEAATEDYRLEQDPLREFFDECCAFGPTCWVELKRLREAYEQHARDVGLRNTLSPRAFADRLKARGCAREKRHRARGWRGIGMLYEGAGTDGTDGTDVPESPLREKSQLEVSGKSVSSVPIGPRTGN